MRLRLPAMFSEARCSRVWGGGAGGVRASFMEELFLPVSLIFTPAGPCADAPGDGDMDILAVSDY